MAVLLLGEGSSDFWSVDKSRSGKLHWEWGGGDVNEISGCLEVEVEGDARPDLISRQPGILLRAGAACVHVDTTLCNL